MDFNEYQQSTAKTAIYPGQGAPLGLYYTVIGLSNELGELFGKIKKSIRDNNQVITEEMKQAILFETGDAIWYLSQFCTELNISLDAVATANIAKLADRKARGVIGGSGDQR